MNLSKSVVKIVLFGAPLLVATACVSTEVVEQVSQPNLKAIVVNLDTQAPEETRADNIHEGHKLRYIAKLFKGSIDNLPTINPQERQELVEGEISTGSVANQMVFYVEPDYTYTIFLYADYIPESATKNSDGEYGDYYYDTHSSKQRATMLTTPEGNATDVVSTFFNNDNYDFFQEALQVDKYAEKIERNIELKRAVAKIRVVDDSSNTGNYSITVSNFSHISGLSKNEINTTTTVEKKQHNNPIVIESDRNFSDAGEKEILFYYTFADENENVTSTSLTLKVDDTNGKSNEISVTSIPVRQNFITTLKGKVLPSQVSGDENQGDDNKGGGDTPGTDDNQGGGDNPGNDDNQGGDLETSEGPIILNLSLYQQDWEQQSSAW